MHLPMNSLLRLHGQAVKTPPFHGGIRGSNPLGVISRIKSGLNCRHGSMAEQLICNQQVVGSTPTVGFLLTIFYLNNIRADSRVAKGDRL